MKNMIAVTKRSKKNKKLLIIENGDKTAIVEVAKVSNVINLKRSIFKQLIMLTWI